MAYTTETNTGLRTPTSYGEEDLYDIEKYNVERLNDVLMYLENMSDIGSTGSLDKDILVWDDYQQKFFSYTCPKPSRLIQITTTTTSTTTTTV